jgi:hypothetical protein
MWLKEECALISRLNLVEYVRPAEDADKLRKLLSSSVRVLTTDDMVSLAYPKVTNYSWKK